MSWNVRGLGDTEILAIKPSIAFLQESKLDSIPVPKLNSFLPCTLDQVVSLPAIGSAGGIFSATNSHILTLQTTLMAGFLRLSISLARFQVSTSLAIKLIPVTKTYKI